MTVPVRLISRLDVKGTNVIKGVHLEGLRVVGKPQALATKYYEQGADEILFMDVVASLYNRNGILPVVEAAAADVFVPMCVGGGVRTLDDMVSVLRSGADKVSINTAAVANPDFLSEAAAAFGSQCIVLSVEVLKRGPDFWEVMTDNGREKTNRNALEWVVEAEAKGVGEILLTSVDMEGTRKGFDLELVRRVRDLVKVPVIACGGAGSAEHVIELIEATGVDAVCCASILHYDICPLPHLKEQLDRAGIKVRA